MSVINKMLRELNGARLHSRQVSPLLRDFSSVPKASKSHWQTFFWFICLMTLFLVYGYFFIVAKYPNEGSQTRKIDMAISQPTATVASSEAAFIIPKKLTRDSYLELGISPTKIPLKTASLQPIQLDIPEFESEQRPDIEEMVAEFEQQTSAVEASNTQEKTQTLHVEPPPKKKLVIERVSLNAAQELDLLEEQLALVVDRPVKRIEIMQRMLLMNPHLHQRRIQLAKELRVAKQYHQARHILIQGLHVQPDQLDLRLDLVDLELFLGRPAQSFAWLEQIEINDTNLPIRFYALRAVAGMRSNQIDDAALMYQHLIQREPTTGRWWLGLGSVCEKQGDTLKALDAYRKAQTLGIQSASVRQTVQQRIIALEADL